MSSPSASNGEDYENELLRDGHTSSDAPFMGGLPHARSSSEPRPDIIPSDMNSGPSLPTIDAKHHVNIPLPDHKAVLHRRAAQPNKKSNPKADSKPARIPPSKKIDIPGDQKMHAGVMDLDDDKELNQDSSDDIENEDDDHFTIYDAVAGRLGYEGLVKEGRQPVSAAEYLLRFQEGPQQDQEHEQFSAHRHLQHRLPDSDLLKAIHAHASDYYGAHPDAKDSFESMDETALIAMGFLLEEFAAERLGETGDLAFVEAARPDEVDSPKPIGRRIKRQKTEHEGHVKAERGVKVESGISGEESSEDGRGRSSGQKRRRRDLVEGSDIATETEAERTDEDPSHNSEVESWISQTLLDSQGQASSQVGAAADLPIR